MAKLLAVKPTLLNSDEMDGEESMPVLQTRSELRPELTSDLRAVARPEPKAAKKPVPSPEPRRESRPAATRKQSSAASRTSVSSSIHVQSAAMKAIESFSTDDSLTTDSVYGDDFESSARLLTPEEAIVIKRNMAMPVAQPTPRPAMEMMPAPVPARMVSARVRIEEPEPAAEEAPRFTSRNWRAEAWEREREREREQRAGNQHAKIPTRRRVN